MAFRLNVLFHCFIVCFVLSSALHIIFHTAMERYSLFVVKVPLNTDQPANFLVCCYCCCCCCCCCCFCVFSRLISPIVMLIVVYGLYCSQVTMHSGPVLLCGRRSASVHFPCGMCVRSPGRLTSRFHQTTRRCYNSLTRCRWYADVHPMPMSSSSARTCKTLAVLL